tara:strand:- start:1265 stop:1792 length:528 start_codon:yes stop_codon:yes gene_type:complete
MHESFWDYSCRVYSQPLVSETCLALQNEHDLDVNLLLFAAWHAHTRGPLDAVTLSAAMDYSIAYSGAVVRSLRKARTWLKKQAQGMDDITMLEREGILDLRQQVKALELHAEHFQQDRLEALSAAPIEALDGATQRRAASVNLHAVLGAETMRDEALEGKLDTLLNALFESPPNA